MKILITIFFCIFSIIKMHSQCIIGDWESIGPTGNPSGGHQGRVISIMAEPGNVDIIYLGSESGGLWKRTESTTSAEILGTDQLYANGIYIIQIKADVRVIGNQKIVFQ